MRDDEIAAAVQTQFHAQLAALGALQDGRVPPERALLEACGGKIPIAAVSLQARLRPLPPDLPPTTAVCLLGSRAADCYPMRGCRPRSWHR